MNWSEETINVALEVLEQNESVQEACDALTLRFGEEVTDSALRHAFRRLGLKSPSHYLMEVDETTTEASESPVKVDAPTVYEWKIDEDVYRFCYNHGKQCLTYEDMEQACFLYSDVDPGQGLTSEEVAQYFYVEKGYDWIDAGFVSWMFKRIGFSKKHYPQAPHQAYQSIEEIAVAASKRKDALLKSQMKVQQIKVQQREIRRLQAELDDLYSIVDFANDITGRPIVKEFDYTELPNKNMVHKIIPIGDLHAGKLVTQRNHYKEHNTYNREQFFRRVNLIADYIGWDAANNPQPDTVIFSALGDWFESIFANMREGMAKGMYNWCEQQYDDVVWAFTTLVKTCRDSYKCHIRAFYTPGNHDRFAKNKEDRSEAFMAHVLTDRLATEFQNDEQVEINKGGTVNSIMLPNGVNYIFFHGHVVPIQPLSQDKDLTNFCKLHGFDDAKRHFTTGGHYHTMLLRSFYGGKALWVPSVCGSDYYSTDNIAKGNPAEFVIVNSYDIGEEIQGPFCLQ